MNTPNTPIKMVIATPVFNDWESFGILLRHLNSLAKTNLYELEVFAIDDGSTQRPSAGLINKDRIPAKIIHLARNMGHQKAISIGIAYIVENIPCDVIIVMDSDGEDNPAEIPALIATHSSCPDKVVFASRNNRSEGFNFKLFYFFYKLTFRFFTGKTIDFGNFSLIPACLFQRVTHLPEIWNHYAAGLMHANLPIKRVPIQRSTRYLGQSKMNFVSLVLHGLSAISVYIEVLTVRLMIAAFAILMLGVVGFGIMLYYRFFTTLAIPGWATNVSIGLAIIISQAILVIILLTFVVLSYRSYKLFVPSNDYVDFLLNIESLE